MPAGLSKASVKILFVMIMMSEVKIHRGRSKFYANFIHRCARFSYYLFSGGKNFSELILSMVDFKDKKRILDIGCGVGNLLLDIKNRLNTKNNHYLMVGADYSCEMIRIALHRFKGDDKPCFVICDASHLPFKPDTFDLAFNVLMLHHLPPLLKKQVLKEMYRILKYEGSSLIMDPDRPTSILGLIIALSRWHIFTIRTNFRYGLEYFFREAGFKSERHIKKLGIFSYYLIKKASA